MALKSCNNQVFQIPYKRRLLLLPSFLRCKAAVAFESQSQTHSHIERITRIINDHPFPDQPLRPTLLHHLPPALLTASFVENVLGRLFASHSNGLKALEFFTLSLNHSHFVPTPDAFEKTIHILARMRYFEKAWELMMEIGRKHPSCLTPKSMSILLSKIAKFQSYEDTLEAFDRMEKIFRRRFGTQEFNVLLRAFCTQREMKEARSVFQKMLHRFPPNSKTMNILLLGFKESGDVTAMELFYHEMVRRGFNPTSTTFNIRIDAYCKKGYFGDGLTIFQEMENLNCFPTLETFTSLIHGAGVARNPIKAQQLFDEIPKRNLQPDIAAHNALISSLIKCKDVKSAISLMHKMEEKHIGHDNITYHTIFLGLMKSCGTDGVCELYQKMTDRNFVPRTQTVVMLMKFFCVNNRIDLGLNFWGYLVDKGYCPHAHALDLLVTGLCSRGRLPEAFQCSKQSMERGRLISESIYRMLERFLLQSGETDKLKELNQIIKKLQSVLPPSRVDAIGNPSSTVIL